MAEIKGLEKTSLIDYPGKVSAVVFLAGCNFRCPYCQNRDLVLEPESQESIPEKEFFDLLRQRKKWLDGVCVSGGEPTLCEDLPDFFGRIKSLGYLVKLDTNGSNPKMLRELIERGLVDYIAMDIKGPFKGYPKTAGVKTDTKKIEESIKLIIGSGIEHEFRSTVMPALHTREDVAEMARMVKGARKFYLQQFRPASTLNPSFQKERPFTKEEMLELRDLCRKYVDTDVRMA